MEFEVYQRKVYADWRKRLLKASGWAIFLLSIVYVVIFFVFLFGGNFKASGESVGWYIVQRIICPLGICITSFFISKKMCLKSRDNEKKNFFVLFSLTTIACVITIFNNYFVLVFAVPTISVIASLTFGNKKVIKNNLIVIYCSLIVAFFTFALDVVHKGQTQYILTTIFTTVIYYIGLSVFTFSLSNTHKKIIDIADEVLEHRESLLNRLHLDSLTGLYNKGYLTEYLSSVIGKNDLYLAIMDLDNFKQINDVYGHLCGDEILSILAQIIEKHLKEEDNAFRFGGDEFVLIYKGTKEQFLEILENIRVDLQNQHYNFGENITLTSSFGATAILSSDTPESVFERSDKLMYEAKHSGKNCCVNDLQ